MLLAGLGVDFVAIVYIFLSLYCLRKQRDKSQFNTFVLAHIQNYPPFNIKNVVIIRPGVSGADLKITLFYVTEIFSSRYL